MKIVGTYDTLLVPTLLPIESLLLTLPPSVRSIQPSPFVLFTHDQIAALGIDASLYDPAHNHPVLFQLGYQQNTGPGPRFLGMSFEEAKLEILGVRHPNVQLIESQPVQVENSFVFKQMIMFSSRMMAMSSQFIAGLRSSLTIITPSKSPSCYRHDDTQTIEYNVKDFIEATLEKDSETGSQGQRTVNTLLHWIATPWYGCNTPKSTVTRFHFDRDKFHFQPVHYKARLRIKLSSFYDPSSEIKASSPQWLEMEGIHACRIKGDFFSQDLDVFQAR